MRAAYLYLLHRYRARCESDVKHTLPSASRSCMALLQHAAMDIVKQTVYLQAGFKGSCAACTCCVLYEPGSIGRLQSSTVLCFAVSRTVHTVFSTWFHLLC